MPDHDLTSKLLDAEAERAVLGRALLHPDCLDWLDLESAHFQDPRNKGLWQAMSALRGDDIPVDAITVEGQLRRAGTLESIGISYMGALSLEAGPLDNLEFHADLLRHARVNRQLAELADSIPRRMSQGLEGEELLDTLQGELLSTVPGRADQDATIATAVVEEYRAITEHMEASERGEAVSVGVPTGIALLDAETGGLPIGIPAVLGARPAVGKSTLALNIAMAAESSGVGVQIFTYEDRRYGWSQRALSRESGVDVSRIRARTLNRQELTLLSCAADTLRRRAKLCIEHAHGRSVEWLCRMVRGKRRELGTGLVIVDYIQLMPGPPGRLKKHEQVTHNMNALTELAGKDELSVLVVSQLNRDIEHRGPGALPQKSDFRDSGTIEQDGKFIIALYEQQNAAPTDLGLLLIKNHQGPPASLVVHYDRPCCRIR